MFQMCGVFAEFERSIIRERINAGLVRAKANGKRLGRPGISQEVEEAIRHALERGDKGIRNIAREMGVGVSVIQRVQRDAVKAGSCPDISLVKTVSFPGRGLEPEKPHRHWDRYGGRLNTPADPHPFRIRNRIAPDLPQVCNDCRGFFLLHAE